MKESFIKKLDENLFNYLERIRKEHGDLGVLLFIFIPGVIFFICLPLVGIYLLRLLN